MTVKLPLPYRRSRALAPGNDLLGNPGVALDVVGREVGADLEAGWRQRIEQVARAIGWPSPTFARRDAEQAQTLAFAAPHDQLQTARTANEWALCAALVELDPCHWGSLRDCAPILSEPDPSLGPATDDDGTIRRLVRLGAAEAWARRTC
jgi:hypothetical protein